MPFGTSGEQVDECRVTNPEQRRKAIYCSTSELKMYPAVVEVFPLSNYHLRLAFANGEVKRFDMNPYLGIGLFRELTEKAMFETLAVSFDTVAWANEADIDPETLYLGGENEID